MYIYTHTHAHINVHIYPEWWNFRVTIVREFEMMCGNDEI